VRVEGGGDVEEFWGFELGMVGGRDGGEALTSFAREGIHCGCRGLSEGVGSNVTTQVLADRGEVMRAPTPCIRIAGSQYGVSGHFPI
jgi:hypothetical protein